MGTLLLTLLSLLPALISAAPPPRCLALANQYCNSPVYNAACLVYPNMRNLTALDDSSATSSTKAWRCYGQDCLTSDHLHYKTGSGCKEYCTRPQLADIVSQCKLPPIPPTPTPPPPPPKPPTYVSEVFTPGELGYPCIRIPSVSLSGDNMTLNAFAECRNFTGDGCSPKYLLSVPGVQSTWTDFRSGNRDICQKQSMDGKSMYSKMRILMAS
jgi:hypothetical protein